MTTAALDHKTLCESGSVTIDRACELIGVGRTMVYSLLRDGQLKAVKIGKRRLILRESITRLLESSIVNNPASN